MPTAIMSAAERAAQIWAVLGLAARNRQILTYQMVGKLIGVPARGLGHLLEPIQSYCLLKQLPPLTILVVLKETGLPSRGFSAAPASELARKQLEVFSFDWIGHGAPKPDELEAAAIELPSRGSDENDELETKGGEPELNISRADVDLILESLKYTKERFASYDGYPSEDFCKDQIRRVNETIHALRSWRATGGEG